MDILDAIFDICYNKIIHLGSGVLLSISNPLDYISIELTPLTLAPVIGKLLRF